MDNATAPATEPAGTDSSFEKGVEDIAALLTDPEEDLPENEGQNQPQAEGAQPEAEAAPEEEGEDDGSQPRDAQGRFVRRAATRDDTFTLDDGTVISVGELARNNLYQRDYTRKTMEHAEKVKTFDADRSRLDEYAQNLRTREERLLAIEQRRLPKPPSQDLLQTDPLGYMQAEAAYRAEIQDLQYLQYQKHADEQRNSDETAKQRDARLQEERGKLLEAHPDFRDRRNYDVFMSDLGTTMLEQYGIPMQKLEPLLEEAANYKVFKDLIFLAKARQSKAKVKADLQAKPAIKPMKGGVAQANPQQAKNSREIQQRREQLRKTGDFDAGVALIESLI